MASNQKLVIEKYQSGKEDNRAIKSRYAGLEFYYTKKHVDEYITPESSVIELGCGTGYYAMHYADKCKEYLGVDISPANIAIFQEKIRERNLKNVTAQVGDATNMPQFPDGSFDVVLCLGPLYHLPPAERERVFAESKRLCKDGGVVAFAYICKVGLYTGCCIHEEFKDIYPSEAGNELVLKQGRDNLRPDLYFYTMPEDMEATAQKHGLRKIKNLGTDFSIMVSTVNDADEERFCLLRPVLDKMAAYESCTGMSNHALLVCRKCV